jgi:hypothetical protein
VGMRGSETCELVFEDVVVPGESGARRPSEARRPIEWERGSADKVRCRRQRAGNGQQGRQCAHVRSGSRASRPVRWAIGVSLPYRASLASLRRGSGTDQQCLLARQTDAGSMRLRHQVHARAGTVRPEGGRVPAHAGQDCRCVLGPSALH